MISLEYFKNQSKDNTIPFNEENISIDKVVMDDKRDKKLVGDRKKQCVGQKLLQWIYEVYPKQFIAAIRQSKGTVTELEEVTPENETSSKTSINSLKDLNKWLEDDGEIYELYGKKYRIKTKSKQ